MVPSDESVYLWSFGDRNNESVILDFLNGRSAFTLAALGTDFLEATFDVGVLPLPKYSEAQENYRHVNWGNNIVVPSSIRNTEMVGDVLELMAYYTSTIVHNAYYDTVLQYKVSNSSGRPGHGHADLQHRCIRPPALHSVTETAASGISYIFPASVF